MAGALSVSWPGALEAQTAMVLDPLGVPLGAETESRLVQALGAVARERGYDVARVPRGMEVGELDPRSGDDLSALADRSGEGRVVAVWVAYGPLGYDILVAVASGPRLEPASRARATSVEGVVDAAAGALREMLPADYATASGWHAPLDPHRARPPSRLGQGLVAFGGALLLGTYLPNVLGSALAGYQPTLWFQGTFDGRWDAFRVVGAVPVIGPFVQLGLMPSPSDGWTAWLVVDGLVQSLAAALLIAGVVVHGEHASATPWIGPGQAGLDIRGAF